MNGIKRFREMTKTTEVRTVQVYGVGFYYKVISNATTLVTDLTGDETRYLMTPERVRVDHHIRTRNCDTHTIHFLFPSLDRDADFDDSYKGFLCSITIKSTTKEREKLQHYLVTSGFVFGCHLVTGNSVVVYIEGYSVNDCGILSSSAPVGDYVRAIVMRISLI